MPRYHFRLHDGDGLHDLDGCELPDLAAVRCEAVRCARDIIGEEVRGGLIDLSRLLEVDDEAGRQVLVLRFDEAVRITRGQATIPGA